MEKEKHMVPPESIYLFATDDLQIDSAFSPRQRRGVLKFHQSFTYVSLPQQAIPQ